MAQNYWPQLWYSSLSTRQCPKSAAPNWDLHLEPDWSCIWGHFRRVKTTIESTFAVKQGFSILTASSSCCVDVQKRKEAEDFVSRFSFLSFWLWNLLTRQPHLWLGPFIVAAFLFSQSPEVWRRIWELWNAQSGFEFQAICPMSPWVWIMNDRVDLKSRPQSRGTSNVLETDWLRGGMRSFSITHRLFKRVEKQIKIS